MMDESPDPKPERQKRPKRVFIIAHPSATLVTGNLFKIELAEGVFGLTPKAIEGKISRGEWLEGRQYHREPDGIWIDKQGVQRWVVTGKP